MFSLSSNYTTYTTPYPSNRLHKATNFKTMFAGHKQKAEVSEDDLGGGMTSSSSSSSSSAASSKRSRYPNRTRRNRH